MADYTDRRRFLQAAGAGTALSLAGCSAFQLDGNREAGGPDGTNGGPEATVTVAVQPDRAALQRRQSEVRSRMQRGNVSRQEAQREMQLARTELLADATDAFEQHVADEPALTVEDSVAELGAFRVTGSTGALIEALSAPAVGALLPASRFEAVRSQAGGPGPTETAE